MPDLSKVDAFLARARQSSIGVGNTVNDGAESQAADQLAAYTGRDYA
jgi:hypothetical protein